MSKSNLEVLETGDPGARGEPTTDSTHIKRRVRELNPGHRDGR